jgi:2-oxo-3-hexenedioate decarboxylase
MQPIPGLTLAAAYALAAERHALRLAAGEVPIGRKIGHTNPATWPAQGISAPTWGWLYASSTAPLGDTLSLAGWREPKVELECVLRIGADGAPDAMALGLEIVDRPYPSWQITVADSVAANGVHAAMRIGPWQPVDADLLSKLKAELRVGDARSAGSSAMVFGSPLNALIRLKQVLAERGAPPLRAGEVVTTGALAPASLLHAGESLNARVEGLDRISLRLA